MKCATHARGTVRSLCTVLYCTYDGDVWCGVLCCSRREGDDGAMDEAGWESESESEMRWSMLALHHLPRAR